jgi:hypothetical protein
MVKVESKIIEIATIEDQITYYKKEYCAVLSEANRQCDIAAELAMKIMKMEEKLCQMKKQAGEMQ